jgi:anti-sigma factor (TIGR02949 family)
MECAEVTRRLWEYLDGELAAKEAADVGRHLASCPHCQPHYCCDRAFLVVVVRSLTRSPAAPSGLRTAILTRLARR